jgi:hypothetical protein
VVPGLVYRFSQAASPSQRKKERKLANALAECPLPVGGPTEGWDFGVPQGGPRSGDFFFVTDWPLRKAVHRSLRRSGDCGPCAGVEAVRWVCSHFLSFFVTDWPLRKAVHQALVHRTHSTGEQDPVGYFRRKAVELLRLDGLGGGPLATPPPLAPVLS